MKEFSNILTIQRGTVGGKRREKGGGRAQKKGTRGHLTCLSLFISRTLFFDKYQGVGGGDISLIE